METGIVDRASAPWFQIRQTSQPLKRRLNVGMSRSNPHKPCYYFCAWFCSLLIYYWYPHVVSSVVWNELSRAYHQLTINFPFTYETNTMRRFSVKVAAHGTGLRYRHSIDNLFCREFFGWDDQKWAHVDIVGNHNNASDILASIS
jgi:hypothetical protein